MIRGFEFKVGEKINGTRLTPLVLIKLPKSKGGNRAYVFQCECGNKTTQAISRVRLGRAKSCGCVPKPQNTRFTIEQVVKAFWEKVYKTEKCWIWNGCRNSDGYGLLAFDRRARGAHRVSWIIHFGKIPNGMSVLHRCDNPPCIRPDHLFLGMQADNVKDCDSKGRRRYADRKGEKSSSVTPFKNADILQIRAEAAAGKRRTRIALERGVCRQSIDNIVNRKTWTHI